MPHRKRTLAIVAACALSLACGDGERTASEPSGARAEESAVVDGSTKTAALEQSRRPNLLLITLDTVRADALGTYGQVRPTTPVIDRLAASGVVFEQALASHAETLPSHSTILTGKLPYAHGVRANGGFVLSERNETLAEVLDAAGYETGVEIAAPVLRRETQITQGFEHYRGSESPDTVHKVIRYTTGPKREETQPIRTAADVSSRAIEFIRENRDREFFLWLHYFDAHVPRSAPATFNRRIPDSPYHAEIASVDFQLGRVVDELDRLGLADGTLVVVTADHGEGLGEHGEISHSYFVYDATMHVPLVFTGLAGLPAGRRVGAPVRTADIAPTILDLLGQPPLEGVQGVSLRPLLFGEASDLQLVAYGEATRFNATLLLPTLRFVRKGNWKYIHKANPELYDVEADPGELVNLASSRPEVVTELRAELERLVRDAPAAPNDAQAEIDAATAQQLVALGYVAQSPMIEVDDDVESLELPANAPDPVAYIDDVEKLSQASGFYSRQLYGRALELLQPILDGHPDSPYVIAQTAAALIGLDRDEEAAELLARELALDPSNTDATRSLAGVYVELGRSAEAIDLMRGLLRVDACDEAVVVSLGDQLRELGRYAELVDVQAKAARECPEMLVNKNNYAWALATVPDGRARNGPLAVEIIRDVIERSGARDPGHLDTLAAALAEVGDFERAREVQAEVVAAFEAAGAPSEILAQVRDHMASFEAGKPLRIP